MRYYHMRRAGKTALIDPLAEDWQPSFGIVEEGAVRRPHRPRPRLRSYSAAA